MKSLRLLAFTTAGFAYALIVLGFIVRITGSGMGCGDDWPLCNGQVIPTFSSSEVVIEWLHRVAVLGLTGLSLAVVGAGWLARSLPGGSGRGGTLRLAALGLGLLFFQSFLGAITVWLELPPHAIVLHLGTAMALLATYVMLGLRAGVHGGAIAAPEPGSPARRGTLVALALGGLVLLFGGMTASTGAGPACEGFPLCSGRLWPAATESGLPHIHWSHRLVAYALFLHLLGMAVAARRLPRGRVRTASIAAFGVVTVQIAVAAVMVLTALPPIWRGLHAAVGTAVWVVLVYAGWLVWRPGGARPVAEG